MQFPIMTRELAIRIENAEAVSWVSRLSAVQRLDGNPLGVEIRQVNGVTALMVRKHHHPELQRVLGLLSGQEAIVDDLLGWYRWYDGNCRFDITPFHASKELLHHLTRRGFFQSGFSTVFSGCWGSREGQNGLLWGPPGTGWMKPGCDPPMQGAESVY